MLIILLSLFLSTVLANSHERYIDLLPEEEKQAFLNKIARRIIERVDVIDNKTKSSRELTDEHLKEHDEFIQNILQEESAHMRRRRSDDTSSSGSDKNTSDDIEVKPLNTNKSTDDENDKSENSSDNENKRNRDQGNDKVIIESTPDYIKVEILTENPQKLQTRYITSGDENNKPKNVLKSQKSKEEVKNLEASVDVKIQTDEKNPGETTTGYQNLQDKETSHIELKESKANLSKSSSSSNEKNSDFSKENITQTTTEILLTKAITSTTTTQIIEPHRLQNDITLESNSPMNITNVKPITTIADENLPRPSTIEPNFVKPRTLQRARITSTDNATSEGAKALFIDLSSYIATDSTSLMNNKYSTKNYDPVSETVAKTVTTTILPGLTATSHEVTGKPKRIIKQTENITLFSYINVVKSQDTEKNTRLNIQKNKEVHTQKKTSLEPYQVHEIRWPDSSESKPFLRSPEPMKNQPYVVPVYKYSPNFAYYNPTNRLGPNAVEDNSIELDKNSLRNGKGEKPEASEFILKLNEELRKFGTYSKKPRKNSNKHKMATSHPDVYNSVDDGDMVMRFPDSNEELHPVNSMKHGLKTHIAAIRDVIHKRRITNLHKKHHENTNDIMTYLYNNNPPKIHTGDSKEKSSEKSAEHTNGHHKSAEDNDDHHKSGEHKSTENNDVEPKSNEHNVVEPKSTEHNDVEPKSTEHIPNEEEESSALRASNDHNNAIDINFYFAIMNHTNYKIKNLHRLQAENTPEVNDVNELVIMSQRVDQDSEEEGNLFKSDLKSGDLSTIAKILAVTDEKNVFVNMEKLQTLNLNLMRRNKNDIVSIYMKVLKNLIEKDSMALKQYDWLATTVQIQSALVKLFRLINKIRDNESIHPADIQILKYAIFIYKFSLEVKGANDIKRELMKQVNVLPKSKKRSKHEDLKKKGITKKTWLYSRTLVPDLSAAKELNNLNEFLLDVGNALFDLHDAITNVAKVTTFKHQNWYDNLKQLYLSTSEKHLRELLLHISMSRMIELMEHSCVNGLERDFIQYIKTHKKESKRTLEEMLFVSKIIDEIKKK